MTDRPVPDRLGDELSRLVWRWHQLPLDQAHSHSAELRAAAATLLGVAQLADLGPAAALDQVRVAAYETVQRADLPEGCAQAVDLLVGLRRRLG